MWQAYNNNTNQELEEFTHIGRTAIIMFLFGILVYVGFALAMSSLAYRSYCISPGGENWDKYLNGMSLFLLLFALSDGM